MAFSNLLPAPFMGSLRRDDVISLSCEPIRSLFIAYVNQAKSIQSHRRDVPEVKPPTRSQVTGQAAERRQSG
jgi:hypothetical protein